MADTIGTKTVGGMVAFLAQMVEKGRARDGVIKPLDTAIRKVFTTVIGDGWEAVDIGSLDLDDYMLRFSNMTNGTYTSSSLSVYKSRVRKSMEWYQKFLTTPGWFPPVRESGNDKVPIKAKQLKPAGVPAGSQTIDESALAAEAQVSAIKREEGMISYPLPLASGKVVQLYLPVRFTQTDAKRISNFVSSLAFEEPETAAQSVLAGD